MIVSVPDTETCLRTFDGLDFNGTGKLNICELEAAVRTVWPRYRHKSAIMRAYRASDVNKDGFIDRNEFELFLRYLALYNNLWFQTTSNDTEERLYKKDFMKTASSLSITDSQQTFNAMDVKSKGFVSYEEFCNFLAGRSLNLQASQGGCFRFVNAGGTRAFGKTRQELFEKEQPTYLTRLVLDLKCSIDFLNGQESDEELESWAICIHDCMSNIQRAPLMGIDTMFEVSHGADPFQMLAIYFSNVVSFEMDSGHLCANLHELVEDILVLMGDNGINYFAPQNADGNAYKHGEDLLVDMVMTMFGVKPEKPQLQELQSYIKDKLLASIVAVRVLKNSLTKAQLAKVVVCIEATVPFSCGLGLSCDCVDRQLFLKQRKDSRRRSLIRSGGNPEQRKSLSSPQAKSNPLTLQDMYDRLEEANRLYSLCLTTCKLEKAVQRAADVVNRFRGVFASTDMESYLIKLWGLLPQFNAALRQPKLYTVGDYHMAVKNLQQVVDSSFEKDNFFVSFRGVPDALEVGQFLRRYRENSKVGKLCIECKAVSNSIVSAFAELTGGDVPYCFLVGDSVGGKDKCGTRRYTSDQMGYGLPVFTSDQFHTKACHGEEEIYRLLFNAVPDNMEATGCFDVTNWAVTAFVYGMLGEKGIGQALPYTSYPMRKNQAMELLSCLPFNVVSAVGNEIGRIAVSRTDKVLDLLDKLSPS